MWSAIIGELKPQFTLYGDTVKKTSRICLKAPPNKVVISKQTKHFLELYTNNYQFTERSPMIKNTPSGEKIFIVSLLKEKNINQVQDHRSRLIRQLVARSPNDVNDMEIGPETEMLIKKMQAKGDMALDN